MSLLHYCMFLVLYAARIRSTKEFNSIIEKFASHLFLSCDVFVVLDEENSYADHNSVDLHSLLWDATSSAQASSGVFLIELRTVPQNFHIPTESIYHRHSSQCSFVILLLEFVRASNADALSAQLSELLVPNFAPATHKDEDYYVIWTAQAIVKSLMEIEFSVELKYKLFLYSAEAERETKSNIKVLSRCFYCNAGQPKILDVSLTIQTFMSHHAQAWDQNLQREYRELIFPEFTRNSANGFTLIVSVQTRTRYIHDCVFIEDEWRLTRGFGKTVLDVISKYLNYTYKIIPASGGGSGTLLKNGTWVGAVRDTMDGTAHVGLGVGLSLVRYKVIDGSAFFYAWIAFVTGKPKEMFSSAAVLWPFQPTLWFGTILAVGVLLLAFKFVTCAEGVRVGKSVESFRGNWNFFIIGALVEQHFKYTASDQSRLLCIIWLFLSYILTIAYKSKLVIIMTFPILENSPRNLHQLAHSDFQWGMDDSAIGGAAHSYFSTSTNQVNQIIFQKMTYEHNSRSCFERGITENFACITWRQHLNYVIHRNFTNKFRQSPLFSSEDIVRFTPAGFVYKKRAHFHSKLDSASAAFLEMGLIGRWEAWDHYRERKRHWEWAKTHPEYLTGEEVGRVAQATHLTLRNLKGCLYILFFMLGVGAVAFTGEVLKGKWNSRKSKGINGQDGCRLMVAVRLKRGKMPRASVHYNIEEFLPSYSELNSIYEPAK